MYHLLIHIGSRYLGHSVHPVSEVKSSSVYYQSMPKLRPLSPKPPGGGYSIVLVVSCHTHLHTTLMFSILANSEPYSHPTYLCLLLEFYP